MQIQESLDRLVNILSSVELKALADSYPHIAEALEIDTTDVDLTEAKAMIDSIQEAVKNVDEDDIPAVVDEIENFFKEENEEEEDDDLSEASKGKKKVNSGQYANVAGKKKNVEVSEEEDEDDDDEGDDEEDEDDDDVEEGKKKKKMKKEDYFIDSEDLDVSEDVTAMLNGEELSEEFQNKAKTIFEAAVVNKVNEKVQAILEEFDDVLEERTNELEEAYAEKMDEYLNYVVNEWVEENKLAITNGIQSEVTESFINGLKDLFEDHYIEVPTEKLDMVEELQVKVKELEQGLNEALDQNAKLNQKLNESNKDDAIEEVIEGLSDVQKEKMKSLLEGIEVEGGDPDFEKFKEKAKIVRENYFPKETQSLNEELDQDENSEDDETQSPVVKAYADALSRLKHNGR